MPEPMKAMMVDFAKNKKTILNNLIIDPEFNKKLNDDTIKAEELLLNLSFVDMFLSTKSDALMTSLSKEDTSDYVELNKISETLQNNTSSDESVAHAQ
jgi:hypothetical protein